MNSRLLDYRPEFESPFSEAQAPSRAQDAEMVIGAELMEAQHSGRLPEFLSNLVARAKLSPALGLALAQGLEKLAQRTFPPAKRTDPKVAGRLLGLELEGLSPEDKEFEVARQFIRFTGHALRRARQLARGHPRHAARYALEQAARHHAPGLLKGAAGPFRNLSSHLEREFIMHDIDRTTLEFGQETSGFEMGESYEFGESEWSGEGGMLGMLTEAEEMELASELLSVGNEAELEQFLGNFLKKAASVAGSVIRSPVGKAIGGVLKGVAKKALPLAGGAIGGYFGGPLGAKIGSGLASAAGGALGLEAEGEMSGEDREFEGARTFVKLAADTVNRAAQSKGGDPRQIAMQAATAAARQFAPGLLGKAGAQSGGQQMGGAARGQGGAGRSNGGRWMRQGRKIVLYGV